MKVKLIRAAAPAAIGVFAIASVARASPVLSTLVAFNGTDGANPHFGLVADSSGNLYGTAEYGGAAGDGTVFELSGVGHRTLTTLATFNGSSGATNPDGMTIDAAGNLYGTNAFGGASGSGAIFELSGPNHGNLNTLFTFTGPNGMVPETGITVDAAGNLFGTTLYGGSYGYGTAFELSGPARQTFVTLVTFNGTNGGGPSRGLRADAAGNYYGATASDGANGDGTVFELSGSNHQTLTTLVNFNGANGAGNRGAIYVDSAGDLFGTTTTGGANNDGTVFEITGASHQTLTTLVNFNTTNGANPYANLVADAAGNLYGTTASGGAYGDGTIFELSGANRQIFTTLVSFNGSNGAGSHSDLLLDPYGNLFGTTDNGGTNNNGVVFELTGVGSITSQPVTVAMGQTYHFSAGRSAGIPVNTVPGLSITAGGTAVVDPAAVHANRQLLVISGGGLVLAGSTGAWTGTLDLGNNDMDVVGGNLATITNQLAQGYAAGRWTGPGGITSASAAADSRRLTALGVIQNNQGGSPLYTATNPFDGTAPGASDILVKYTYYGDANLDGVVNGIDYGRIDAGYSSGGALTGWFNGDFNYDGRVDGSDYTLIDNAFDGQTANLSTSVIVATSTAEPAAVPEPAELSLVAVVAVLGGRRSRR